MIIDELAKTKGTSLTKLGAWANELRGVMEPDDEIVFGRALDESRACLERIECLRRDVALVTVGGDVYCAGALEIALAIFELHGATLLSLAKWYPAEPRVRLAALEWHLVERTPWNPSSGFLVYRDDLRYSVVAHSTRDPSSVVSKDKVWPLFRGH